MKKIIFLLVLFLCLGFINSSILKGFICPGKLFFTYPNDSILFKNSKIILNGYNDLSRFFFQNLAKSNGIFLESDDHAVKCDVEEVYIGEYRIFQIVLVPSEELILGEEYKLFIDEDTFEDFDTFNEDEDEEFIEDINDSKKHKWTVIDSKEYNIPKWEKTPQFGYTSLPSNFPLSGYYFYFDQKLISLPLTVNGKEKTIKNYIKVELKNHYTNKSEIFIHDSRYPDFFFYRGDECYYSLYISRDSKYSVRFQIFDIYTAKEQEWTDWIEFTY